MHRDRGFRAIDQAGQLSMPCAARAMIEPTDSDRGVSGPTCVGSSPRSAASGPSSHGTSETRRSSTRSAAYSGSGSANAMRPSPISVSTFPPAETTTADEATAAEPVEIAEEGP